MLPRNPNPRLIESQIISYIMSLRENGIAYATIQYLVAPIITFYQLNDITLNRKKVSRYLGEYKRVAKDGAYTAEQIQAVLQNADSRMRMLLLILSIFTSPLDVPDTIGAIFYFISRLARVIILVLQIVMLHITLK